MCVCVCVSGGIRGRFSKDFGLDLWEWERLFEGAMAEGRGLGEWEGLLGGAMAEGRGHPGESPAPERRWETSAVAGWGGVQGTRQGSCEDACRQV